MSTIPASLFSEVLPGVLAAGGDALDLSGLVLTNSWRVPIGKVYSFANATAVGDFFGDASKEAQIAGGGTNLGTGYFGGFVGATQSPGALLFAQYPSSAVAAYLQGGSTAGLTLAGLQALSGSLTVIMDGYTHVIASINLATETSFSNAAAAIQAAFTDPTEASFTASCGAAFTGNASGATLTVTAVTGYISPGDVISGAGVPTGTTIKSQNSGGTPGGAGTYVTSVVTTASSASLTTTSNVIDVTNIASGTVSTGQTVATGLSGSPLITGQVSGTTGGVGLYTFSGAQQSVASTSMTAAATAPLVTFDSTSAAFIITSGVTGTPSTAAYATGTLAAPLFLTQTTGAILSQGAAAAVPATFMNGITNTTQNWATFMTAFNPDGSGNANKYAFAAWNNTQSNRYMYVAWDTDIVATEQPPQTECLGYLLSENDISGTCPVYESTDTNLAAFVCGWAASLDFSALNGRSTLAFRSQTGLVASVTDGQTAVNLGGNPLAQGSFGNGYNYYGAVGSANQNFVFMQRGTVSGPFLWADTYVNQIQLNAALQLSGLLLMTQVGSIPFNATGATMVENALLDDINAAINFGTIRAGVQLSSSQITALNNAAGVNAAAVVQTQGWYLQIPIPSPTVRQNRGPISPTLWYTDGQSVQSILLNSIVLL
jgi:hypothetical protein